MKQLSYVDFYRAMKEFNVNVIVYNSGVNPTIDVVSMELKLLMNYLHRSPMLVLQLLLTKSLRGLMFQIFLRKSKSSSM